MCLCSFLPLPVFSVGSFLEEIAVRFITAPIFQKVIAYISIDSVQFGAAALWVRYSDRRPEVYRLKYAAFNRHPVDRSATQVALRMNWNSEREPIIRKGGLA